MVNPSQTIGSIYADRLLADPGNAPASRHARILLDGGSIDRIEQDIQPNAEYRIGGPGTLVLPAFCNAHDHGRGLRPIAYGAVDQPLELWLPATYTRPPVDPYLFAAVSMARLVRGGFASAVHCHMSRPPAVLIEEAEAAARAAGEIGLRIAFVVPLRDRNRLAYADDDTILARLDPEVRENVTRQWLGDLPPISEQLACVTEIAERCEGPQFHVQYGPVGVEFCSDALLERVAEDSARDGRRVHMHLLETRYAREWTDTRFPDGVVRHLDHIGLLSERLTVAHGVWLRPDECELLAERKVTVSINTCSNMRLRSGTAPVEGFLRAGVRLALGMDGLSFDDDEDGLREARLTYRMHAGTGMDEILTPRSLFEAACRNGPHAVTGQDCFGTVAPGKAADLMVLDRDAMAADLVEDLVEDVDIFFARANARHVRAVVAAGRCIFEDGRLTGFDDREAVAELTAQARRGGAELQALKPWLKRYQAALKDFYQSGGHRR